MKRTIASLIGKLASYGTVLEAASELSKIGSEAVGALMQVLEARTKASLERVYAAITLGQIQDRRATPALLRILSDAADHWEVRRRAAWALGEINDPRSEKALMTALKSDQSPDVRGFAAEALGKMKVTRALPVLVSRLNDVELMDDFTLVAYRAIGALGSIGGAKAEAALLEVVASWLPCSRMDVIASEIFMPLLGSPVASHDDLKCRLALEQLGKWGDVRILPELVRLRSMATSDLVKAALEQAVDKVKRKC